LVIPHSIHQKFSDWVGFTRTTINQVSVGSALYSIRGLNILPIMKKRGRGRPKGTGGPVAVLSSEDEKLLARFLRHERSRDERAELAILLSMTLGLRATELAALRHSDVYDLEGRVRTTLVISQGRLAGPTPLPLKAKELRIALADYLERRPAFSPVDPQQPLFRSERGGHLTSASMARYLSSTYRKAGIAGATSRSGRATKIANLLALDDLSPLFFRR
jgi:integrase/recombinase XerD